MQRLFLPLRKLQWQLSLSYILVVVVAIPILLGVGLAMVALRPSLSPSEQLVQLLERDVAVRVPRLAPGQERLNWERLNAWIVDFVLNQNPRKPVANQSVPQLNAAETRAALVIDRTGKLVGSDPIMPPAILLGETSPVDFFLRKMHLDVPRARQCIQLAFSNDQHLANLVTTQPDGQTLAAVPLLDSQQSVTGVLFVVVRGLRSDPQASSNAFSDALARFLGDSSQPGSPPSALLPYALLLLAVVSGIGVIFGMVTARRITWRLQRITSAAHAWSVGDFQVHVPDRSPDELGQLARDLNRMAGQVQALLNTQQQLASLEERQRVARDLHDSVKQQAFALTLLIGAAQSRLPEDPVSAQSFLGRAGELSDHIRQELTTILQQLRPVALAGQGLQMALRDHTHQWTQQTAVPVEFCATGVQVLNPEIEEALFRVTQEVLSNVARHSQATRVQVQVEQGAEQVSLLVRDNGKGFRVENVTGSSQGLTNMHERVERHQGTICISSKPGETVVRVCIPLVAGLPRPATEREGAYE